MTSLPNPPLSALNTKADFCLEIKFAKGAENPSRVFRAMSNLIEVCQRLDSSLVQTIDVKIQPLLVLEDVETSSLRAWMKTLLEAVDDDALKKVDWKPAVGKYLVKAKYYIIDFIGHNATVSDKRQIAELSQKLLTASQETDAKHIPFYSQFPETELVQYLQALSEATSVLQEGDSVKYITAAGGTEGEASFNLSFQMSAEAVEDLLTKETISTPQIMILKVRKPDYLGESMWEFRFQNRNLTAKILDTAWLKKFQQRLADVRPGDAIKADVIVDVRYGFQGDVISIHHSIIKIHEIITVDTTPHPQMFD
jgi:hypothetical protein